MRLILLPYVFTMLIVFSIKAQSISSFVIDDSSILHRIDFRFYGVNISPHVNLPNEKILKDIGIGRVRVGGNEFDAFNWKNSTVYNPEYGFERMQDLKSIFTSLNNKNIEAIYQVNLTGIIPQKIKGKWIFDSSFSTTNVRKMILKYNSSRRTFIKNFSLGNEFDQWDETHSYYFSKKNNSKKNKTSADKYIDRFIKTAVELRKTQKEINGKPYSIKIWGPEISSSYNNWQTENTSKDCRYVGKKGDYKCSYGDKIKFSQFIPYFLHRLKLAELDPKINPQSFRLLDFLSFHYYPTFRTNKNDPQSLVKNKNNQFPLEKALESSRIFFDNFFTNSIDLSSPKSSGNLILKKFTDWALAYGPDLKIGLTEFGIDPDDRVNSYPKQLRPLFLADLIGIASTNGLSFINKFRVNSYKPNNSPWSLLKDNVKTDLYSVYKLFTTNYLGEVLKVISKDKNNDLAVYATKLNNRFNVFFINKSKYSKEYYASFKIKGMANGLNKSKISPYQIVFKQFDKSGKILKEEKLSFK